ncbi:hypothetical protein [Ileibacterium valens]|uniref:Uncharacterized protein n=2 Tax=cellular organisms TaxID=131567 RepID=A0A1U7NHV1_9FIRM|nr:hypothetical protein [Ileibacterium valens]OLU40446.1 hypothetical protein BO224_05490 [Erysipelotrichaceae bacterium NYU-BL-E8]OLU41666.1 hypothetical protein BO222_02890 [Ileibacterium valens]OLU42870.1 hypothetical protein BM735_01375 [Erysipelotrichaceae bacterium NYU-BL-F16]
MPKPLKTIEHSLAKSIEHLSDLEAELKLLKSIDLELLIKNLEEEIRLERMRVAYLHGLRAKEFGC